ncbi:ArnT family glycosyltransferase [Rhodovulum marinum]|uniref:Dolichyl-phosphate-mannose-protein mannosyltransferase n=1 Tax=Rhodovulum marinum TaxID=320662 RepID=A0A4R2Q4Z5_9RHOB|nr:glycosyltransferase family 39 protein [Rhodovulum marinum]TCP41751.1 dolichyl-phosphate-mannose-protein mannosyltransferase [Rhodovulum marinum]
MNASFSNLRQRIFADPPSVSRAAPGRGILPVLVAGLVIAVAWGVHLGHIPAGGISWYDEFHTLDRSAGFARHDDWLTVYNKNEPGFRKPPLQYWMTGALMQAGADLEVALRLPSMLFALGTLAATGWLAAILLPGLPWAIPAAVLLCASSFQFWSLATSAMLDTGAALFATLALIAAILALRRPLWWYGMALFVGLGALQKAPIGLVLVLLFIWALNLTRARHDFAYARLKDSPHFLRGLRLAILAALAWPLFQTVLYGGEVLEDLYGGQMIERFAPVRPLKDPRSGHDLWQLIVSGEPFWRLPAIAALLWLPWHLRRPELLAVAALFAIYVVAMGLAGGSVYARYTLIFVPLLAAALAVVALSLFRVRWLGWGLVLAISAASGGPIRSADALRLEQSARLQTQIAVLSEMAGLLRPDETLVTCNWTRETRFLPGAVSYYAAVHGRPFVGLDSPGQVDRWLERGRMPGPLRGVCTNAELDRIADRLVGLVRGAEQAGYVFWTAEAAR